MQYIGLAAVHIWWALAVIVFGRHRWFVEKTGVRLSRGCISLFRRRSPLGRRWLLRWFNARFNRSSTKLHRPSPKAIMEAASFCLRIIQTICLVEDVVQLVVLSPLILPGSDSLLLRSQGDLRWCCSMHGSSSAEHEMPCRAFWPLSNLLPWSQVYNLCIMFLMRK